MVLIVGDGQAGLRRQGDDGGIHHRQLGLGHGLGADHIAGLHPSWTLAGMPGTLPPLRRSTWPLIRVNRPTTAAWAAKGTASAANVKRITTSRIFCRMISPPLGGAGVLPGLCSTQVKYLSF